jgi:biotin carboxyl carrier protein
MELVVRFGEREERVRVRPLDEGAGLYEVEVGERRYRVDRAAAGLSLWSLLIAGEQHEVAVRADGRRDDGAYLVSVGGAQRRVEVFDPLSHLARRAHGAAERPGAERVTAYMPGRVVAVLAAEGDTVAPGQGVVVLEAMKMQNEIQADRAGVLKRLHVSPGQAVEGGDPLFDVE